MANTNLKILMRGILNNTLIKVSNGFSFFCRLYKDRITQIEEQLHEVNNSKYQKYDFV